MMQHKFVVILMCCAMLQGCAISKQITGPDGKAAHTIECSGWAMTWGACLEKAGELCGTNGYNLVFAHNESGQITNFGQFGMMSTPTMQRVMVIQCNE